MEPKTYTTGRGIVFTLRPVSSLLVRQLTTDEYGKPKPPEVETFIGPKKVRVVEKNDNDPDYLAELARWNEAKQRKMFVYLWSSGVSENPTPEDHKRLKEFFPGYSVSEIKYTWILEQQSSDDEVGALTEAILGQNIATAKGISDAEESFQSGSEQP